MGTRELLERRSCVAESSGRRIEAGTNEGHRNLKCLSPPWPGGGSFEDYNCTNPIDLAMALSHRMSEAQKRESQTREVNSLLLPTLARLPVAGGRLLFRRWCGCEQLGQRRCRQDVRTGAAPSFSQTGILGVLTRVCASRWLTPNKVSTAAQARSRKPFVEMILRVQSYSGRKVGERPLRFQLGGAGVGGGGSGRSMAWAGGDLRQSASR
jgi:hypothetical protein